MKIFLADGRLGNQIFQYVFLKTIQKNNERIIGSGFDDLLNVFDIEDNTLIHIPKNNKWIRIIVYRLIKPTLYNISDLKIISSIQVKHEKILEKYRRETTKLIEQKGILRNIYFIKLGFFQAEKFFEKSIIKKLKIKENFLNEAIQFLKPIEDRYKVFIHIRRGDYKKFKVYGKCVLLPMSYYHNQIKWFLKNKKDCCFIFLSDDPDFIEKEFNYLKNKVISRNSYAVDFAIMTLCNGAILSPSSFGWWGSYLMTNKDVVFAPKYWLGFRSMVCYQKSAEPSFAKLVEIE